MELNNLTYTKGARGHKRRTYGRGFSSGLGKTSGRGQKGQHSRKSGNVRIGFEGGQTPIYRKIPKVGFNSYNFATDYYVVSLAMHTQELYPAMLMHTVQPPDYGVGTHWSKNTLGRT